MILDLTADPIACSLLALWSSNPDSDARLLLSDHLESLGRLDLAERVRGPVETWTELEPSILTTLASQIDNSPIYQFHAERDIELTPGIAAGGSAIIVNNSSTGALIISAPASRTIHLRPNECVELSPSIDTWKLTLRSALKLAFGDWEKQSPTTEEPGLEVLLL